MKLGDWWSRQCQDMSWQWGSSSYQRACNMRAIHCVISDEGGILLSGRRNWRLATIGVSQGCASVWWNCSMMRSINTIWDVEIVWLRRSWLMVMPSANLAGSRSEISHQERSSALKQSVSLDKEEATIMSSTCTVKIIVLVADVQW